MYYFQSEQKWQKELIRDIAKKFNLNPRVVRTLVYYPIVYLNKTVRDDEDETPVRIRHLGVWALKPRRSKRKNVTKPLENS